MVNVLRLLIADDHPIFRNGLKQIVADEDGMDVADEAIDGKEVLGLIGRNSYDVLVLDIEMPGISGLDVLKQVKYSNPTLPVLMLSFYPEEQYALRAFKLGAAGYLTKESAATEFVTAVKQIADGKKYITSSLAQRLALLVDNKGKGPPHEYLSDREYQVLCMIGKGLSITEISQNLHLSPKTVSTYKTRVFEKMRIINDYLNIQIEDNGIGISTEEVSMPDSVGILGMSERAYSFGGSVAVKGKPQQGTTVELIMPLKS